MPRLLDVIETGDTLGEGPVWNAVDGRLWWTDIQRRRLQRLDPGSRRVDVVITPERLASFAFTTDPARILGAFETGLGLFAVAGENAGEITWLARHEHPARGRRFNDGQIDRHGNFWVSTMVEDQAVAVSVSAGLFRLGMDGGFRQVLGGVGIGNGLCLSPDGRTLYFADSAACTIDAFTLDPATGDLTGPRRFADVTDGHPDGAAVDSAGDVWSARWDAGSIVRHAPDGRAVETLPLPVSRPTCVAFGGVDYRLMFVTTARDGLGSAALSEQPLAGSLLVYETDVAGLPDLRYHVARPREAGHG